MFEFGAFLQVFVVKNAGPFFVEPTAGADEELVHGAISAMRRRETSGERTLENA